MRSSRVALLARPQLSPNQHRHNNTSHHRQTPPTHRSHLGTYTPHRRPTTKTLLVIKRSHKIYLIASRILTDVVTTPRSLATNLACLSISPDKSKRLSGQLLQSGWPQMTSLLSRKCGSVCSILRGNLCRAWESFCAVLPCTWYAPVTVLWRAKLTIVPDRRLRAEEESCHFARQNAAVLRRRQCAR